MKRFFISKIIRGITVIVLLLCFNGVAVGQGKIIEEVERATKWLSKPLPQVMPQVTPRYFPRLVGGLKSKQIEMLLRQSVPTDPQTYGSVSDRPRVSDPPGVNSTPGPSVFQILRERSMGKTPFQSILDSQLNINCQLYSVGFSTRGLSLGSNEINPQPKTSLSSENDVLWMGYIEEKIEEQMFKLGVQIDFDIEEDTVGLIIYHYEYKLDAV